MIPPWLNVSGEVAAALAAGRPVVALESTLIAHGLPWPANLETAREAEAVARAAGAVPATIAVLHGTPTVGLSGEQVEGLALSPGVLKASRRDLGAVVGLKKLAATTVSATMALAHAAGIRVFATGGIGGAHRENPADISADLTELARTPVLVVCAGAKSILDLPRTLEILETLGVPVLGYRTHGFPEFYVASQPSPLGGEGGSRSEPGEGTVGDIHSPHPHPLSPKGRGETRLPVSARVETPAEAAAVFAAHVRMGGGGAVLVQPCPEEVAVPPDEFDRALGQAMGEAQRSRIAGPKITPFLLSRLAEITKGRTLAANRALIVANARLAGEVAVALGGETAN